MATSIFIQFVMAVLVVGALRHLEGRLVGRAGAGGREETE